MKHATMAQPFARGVDTLMYVGDDGTAAPATELRVLTTPQLVGVGITAVLSPKGKRAKYAGYAAAVGVLFNIATGKFAV